MAKSALLDGQQLDPQLLLDQVASLLWDGRFAQAAQLFRTVAEINPTIPNFNYVKSLLLQDSSCSFLRAEALRRELEISPHHQDAQRLLGEIEAGLRRDPKKFAEVFPSPDVFSIVMVVSPDWRETHRAIRAALHQMYPCLEVLVVQPVPDTAVGQALTQVDPRVRVLEAEGQSFWEAMEYGLRHATGRYHIVVSNPSVVFADKGLLALATTLKRAPEAHFITGLRGFINRYGFSEAQRVAFPRFSRASFLNERNFSSPTLTLDFTGVVWTAELFQRVGNCLATNLREAIDFELFLRFFREVPLVSVGTQISFREKPVLMGSDVLSVRYSNEALALIRRENREVPLGQNDAVVGAFMRPEDFFVERVAPVAPSVIAPLPAPSELVNRFLNSEAPIISLVMPSFNQAQFLEQAIDSVLSQGYPRLDFMILDGGSTDESVEIIKRYQKYLSYWSSESDEGQYFAVQRGFDRATGEVMGWLNSDDKLTPSALIYVGLSFLVFPHVRWASGRSGVIHQSGSEHDVQAAFAFSRKGYLEQGFDRPFIQQEGTFWRRSLWEEAGGALNLRFSLAGDCELWHRFFRFSQLHSIDCTLGLARAHPNQRSRVNRVQYLQEAQQIVAHELELINGGVYAAMLPAPAILDPISIMAMAEEQAAAWEATRL